MRENRAGARERRTAYLFLGCLQEWKTLGWVSIPKDRENPHKEAMKNGKKAGMDGGVAGVAAEHPLSSAFARLP
jgi:hypothetical protein